jgi:hypothetical protein
LIIVCRCSIPICENTGNDVLLTHVGGNISALPKSIDLIVGPGFKNEFLPGYPSNEKSPFWESDFKDRNVIEAPFNMKIGKYEAWDFLGDGSIYILNVPGHAVGHVSALVRTTPDTGG